MIAKMVYFVSHWNKYSKDFSYSVTSYPPGEGSEMFLIEERELHFETPNDLELRQRAAKALMGKKTKIAADAYVETKEVDELLQEMLALEDKS